MGEVAFNTLEMAKELQASGMEDKQAEATAAIMNKVINERVATKADLAQLGASMDSKLEKLGTSLRHDMEKLGTSLRHDMESLELRMMVKFGALQIAIAGLLMAIAKLIF